MAGLDIERRHAPVEKTNGYPIPLRAPDGRSRFLLAGIQRGRLPAMVHETVIHQAALLVHENLPPCRRVFGPDDPVRLLETQYRNHRLVGFHDRDAIYADGEDLVHRARIAQIVHAADEAHVFFLLHTLLLRLCRGQEAGCRGPHRHHAQRFDFSNE